MEFNFENKHALVTGAGKGIGREIARALWSAGAVTYALSRTQTDLDSLQEECPGIHTICIDLTADWDKTEAAVKSIGPIDILVNNAGVFHPSSPLTVTEDEYEETFQSNVKSVVNVTQAVAGGMVERGQGGAIVNMSSVASSLGFMNTYLYCASKGALDQLTRCMAVELGPHQIRVNALNPTIIPETDMGRGYIQMLSPDQWSQLMGRYPLKHLPKLQNAVDATLFLLSEKASMVSGAFLPIDAGLLCT